MTDQERCVRVVEDSDVLAEMIGVMLEYEGIRFCKTTSNFEILLGPVCWEGVTTTLCDLDLGGPVTGDMILEYLKGAHPRIRRVVLSAVSEVSSARIVSLADVVLAKPADLGNIMAALR